MQNNYVMDNSLFMLNLVGLGFFLLIVAGILVDLVLFPRFISFLKTALQQKESPLLLLDSKDTLIVLLVLVICEAASIAFIKIVQASSSLSLVTINLFFEIFILFVALELLKKRKLSLGNIHFSKPSLPGILKKLPFLYTAMFAIFFLGGLLSFVICKKFGIEYTPSVTEFIMKEKDYRVLVILGIEAVIIAPVVEEILFRGIIYNSFKRRNALFAAVISSFIFALFHKEIAALIPIFILGLAFALIYEKYKNLWHCILLHALHNGLMLSVAITMKLLVKKIPQI